MRVYLLLPILAACANSGLGKTDLSTGATGDTGGAVAGPQDCPWVGAWDLTAVHCSTFPFDEWYESHTGATMEISQDPAGGCLVAATLVGASCTRTEDWHFSSPAGTDVEVDRRGIASCDPQSCTFAPGDPPCNPGDFAGTELHSIDDSSGSLTATDLLADTAPTCTLGLVTTWAPQAR